MLSIFAISFYGQVTRFAFDNYFVAYFHPLLLRQAKLINRHDIQWRSTSLFTCFQCLYPRLRPASVSLSDMGEGRSFY